MSFSSIARVATDRPERYAKQLVSHLGRKLDVEDTDSGSRLTFRNDETGAAGVGEVVVSGEAELTLRAESDDAEMLSRIEDVLGRHLVRFGERDGLHVEWDNAGVENIGVDEVVTEDPAPTDSETE